MIICIVGESGSGKTTLETALTMNGYMPIVSYTTREPRCEELGKLSYYFVDESTFEELYLSGNMIEYCEYNGNLYGSPKIDPAQDHVVVLEKRGIGFYKEFYGDNCIIVKLIIPEHIRQSRIGLGRYMRTEQDLSDIEADITIDSSKPVDVLVKEILNYIRNRSTAVTQR